MLNKDPSVFRYHAWLASASLSPKVLRLLLDRYLTPEEIFHMLVSERKLPEKIPPAGLDALIRNASEEHMKKMDDLLERNRIRVFTIKDHEYPTSLLMMQEPPALLFYQGDIQSIYGRLLAMVGSRAASYDGLKAARKIARELSRKGIGIVSGMAGGIDTASHQGCLEGGSPTIAVTGCGLDMVYPAGNEKLRNEILNNGGLMLSEYAPGEKPVGWHFPFRNRIITGIGSALAVIEAKIRSGTMTSVQHALNQGKEVFVYPGDPTSPYSEGNHQLLREGALYFTTADDILEDLGWLDNTEIIRQNSGCSVSTPAPSAPEETLVLTALKPGRLSFEQIAERCGLSPATLMSTLTMLQIKGEVEALPGKQYQLKV